MISKPHRQNSDFQLEFFMAGDCKTPDGKWALLYSQKIDAEKRVGNIEVQRLARESRRFAALSVLRNWFSSKAKKLQAKSDLLSLDADENEWQMNVAGVRAELATINRLMSDLEPYRKYGHLSILEATEACQREEWRLELECRAENFLLSQGSIPWDHLNAMRSHPDFSTHIAQRIYVIKQVMKQCDPWLCAMAFDQQSKQALPSHTHSHAEMQKFISKIKV